MKLVLHPFIKHESVLIVIKHYGARPYNPLSHKGKREYDGTICVVGFSRERGFDLCRIGVCFLEVVEDK